MVAPRIFDARVHLLPDSVTKLIWKNYAREAWEVRYQLLATATLDFLDAHGVEKVAGICYASQPGIASFLNDFMAGLHARRPAQVVPFGTVHPGDDDCAREVVRVLDTLGFVGIKLHCHLFRMAPDDPALASIFDIAAERNKIINLHSGAVTKNNVRLDAVRAFCNVDRFRRALRRRPALRIIVPHIGYDEVQAYLDLMDEFPNLHFDTAMAFGGHRVAIGETIPDVRPLALARYPCGARPPLPDRWRPALEQLVPQMEARPTRFLYGSDFPYVPYDWDLEIRQLTRYLSPDVLARVLWDNAVALFGAAREATRETAAAPQGVEE
ncbi:amidohydrolase family protein [Burkholderia gladioli]|uniref:Amidohydrolase family protein n=1 Tax=Burkholderia gladioli (strain BSR3) TaxID=999541 RepID=F2LT47_BURGS|nr:amidohydrolase family protein [Burkholderia gladioli]AEA65923.1 amidohydrolase family protein [Burkholderia gladioli BSR3]MBW5286837.1 amidohydrolase family protein [Burkholderia gladioli]